MLALKKNLRRPQVHRPGRGGGGVGTDMTWKDKEKKKSKNRHSKDSRSSQMAQEGTNSSICQRKHAGWCFLFHILAFFNTKWGYLSALPLSLLKTSCASQWEIKKFVIYQLPTWWRWARIQRGECFCWSSSPLEFFREEDKRIREGVHLPIAHMMKVSPNTERGMFLLVIFPAGVLQIEGGG